MASPERGKKLVEEIELEPFLEEYAWLTATEMHTVRGGERPDFIASSSDGLEVGIELAKVMRGPESAFWDRVLRGEEFASPIDSALALQELVYRKDSKRASPGWTLPDRSMLVLQLMDCPIDEVTASLDQEVLAEMCKTGFLEIWLADYTIVDAYGTVQLFGIKPTKWQGLHPHSRAGTKPYG